MKPVNVVVASNDPIAASRLAASLNQHFRSVAVARSLQEARAAITKNRAQLAVVDLETLGLPEVQQLCREFRHVRVICTHRLADEEMWAAALAAGAIDCCYDADVPSIVQAVNRNMARAHSSAA